MATTELTFPTVKAVFTYLESGFRVSRSGVYLHFDQGKFKRNAAGVFTQKAVSKYAKTFLKRKISGRKISDEYEHLQREKLEAEIRLRKAQASRAEFDQSVVEAKYLLRADFELELAARAAVFDAGFRYFFQSMAPEIIVLVGGNIKKIPEFIAAMNTKLDEQLNEYATTKEYQVMILGPEDDASGDQAADRED